MKKILKYVGYGLAALILILGAFLLYARFSPIKVYPVQPISIQLPADSMSLAFGKEVIETECIHCHLGEDGKLSGKLFTRPEDPFGEMWSGNITQHPTLGIGRYTDGELAYLLRTGINREGRYVGNMMVHPKMSDQHLASVIAYLRSDADILQPSNAVHPAPEYLNSTLVRVFLKLGMFEPLPYDGKPIEAPSSADKVAYGRYLATEVYPCAACHSTSFETYLPLDPESSPGYFAGGNLIPDDEFNEIPSANLTPSKAYGIGSWTEEQFVVAVKTGARPDEKILKPQMPRFASIDEEKIRAIWAYLQTLPAVEKPLAVQAK